MSLLSVNTHQSGIQPPDGFDTNLVASFYPFRFEHNPLRHSENPSPTLLQSTSPTFNARVRQDEEWQ